MQGEAALMASYKFAMSGSTTWNGTVQKRHLNSNADRGSGVLIGLSQDLASASSHTISLEHATSGDELTTKNAIVCGF